MLALGAVGAGEAVSKDAALEIAAEGSLDMGRRCFTVLAAGELQRVNSLNRPLRTRMVGGVGRAG